MVIYTYLGFGTTDNNGKATLEFDPNGDPLTHSYTGTGAGEIDIIASLDDEIGEASIISNDYRILDGIFLDKATTGNKNNNWNNPSNYIDVGNPTDNGTTLTNTSGTRHYWSNNYTQFNGPFAIEVDIINYTGDVGFRVTGTNYNFAFSNYNVPSENAHLRLKFENGNISYEINGGTPSNYATGITDTKAYIGFRFAGAGTITYRNFIIYPL
jgi:hypothetical protein